MGDAKRRRESDPNFGQPPQFLDVRADQSVPMFSNLPPGTTQDDYLQHLEANWDTLAAFAYTSFLSDGKGALVLDWDLSLDAQLALLSPDLQRLNRIDTSRVKQQIYCPSFYLGERTPLKDLLGPAFLGGVERLIGTYDPESMIVLCLAWGYTATATGNLMARTIAQAGRLAPVQLYLKGMGQQQEFSFFARSNEAPPAPPSSRVVRAFQISVQHSAEFRKVLRDVFQSGSKEKGKGAVLAIPDREGAGMQPFFLPVGDIATTLGADVQERPYQQAIAFIGGCRPDQLVCLVVDEGMHTSENFKYYPFLVNLPAGEC